MTKLKSRRVLVALSIAGSIAAAGLFFLPVTKGNAISARLAGDANRGAYLARASGCIACHSDFQGGGQPLAGGPPLKTPFGTFYAPNLTSDVEHGIGSWTLQQFSDAVRHGVSPEGSPYYPAFPYPFYTRLTDRDIADLWSAFRTVPPVPLASKPHDLNFPFSIRPGLKLWRTAFFGDGVYRTNSTKSEIWNRGAYLVTGPTHCGACHTPRNFAGARAAEEALHGAGNLPGGGESPPITTDALTKAGWNKTDLIYALRTGLMPDGDSLGGSMGEVVREGTSFMTDEDLNAIATYLLDAESSDPGS